MSFELQDRDAVAWLDPRFNTVWAKLAAEHYPFLFLRGDGRVPEGLLGLCANIAFHNTWFLHFAGGRRNPVVKEAFELVDPDIESVTQLLFPEDWAKRAETIELVEVERLAERDHELREAGEDPVTMV